jgi:hypothetical protein
VVRVLLRRAVDGLNMHALLVLGLAFGFLCSWIAGGRGRSSFEGFLLGFLLGPLGMIIELILPRVPDRHGPPYPTASP